MFREHLVDLSSSEEGESRPASPRPRTRTRTRRNSTSVCEDTSPYYVTNEGTIKKRPEGPSRERSGSLDELHGIKNGAAVDAFHYVPTKAQLLLGLTESHSRAHGFLAYLDEQADCEAAVDQMRGRTRTRARSKSFAGLPVAAQDVPHSSEAAMGPSNVNLLKPKLSSSAKRFSGFLTISKRKSPIEPVAPPSVILSADDKAFTKESSLRILEQIGSGGSGALISACYVDGWLCAVKELDTSKARQSCISDFEREIEIMSLLPKESPFLARILKAQRTENKLMMFMSLYEADLSAILKQLSLAGCHLPETAIVDWSLQILRGLQQLHQRLILHRDVKSGNVFTMRSRTSKLGRGFGLFDRDSSDNPQIVLPDEVVLGDFGESKKLDIRSGRTATVVGTPAFNSPEMLGEAKRGQLVKSYSYQVDIWAFGQLVTEMMTLKPPYGDVDHFEALNLASKGERPRLALHVAQRYPNVIPIWEQILEKDAEARPSISNLLSLFSSLQ